MRVVEALPVKSNTSLLVRCRFAINPARLFQAVIHAPAALTIRGRSEHCKSDIQRQGASGTFHSEVGAGNALFHAGGTGAFAFGRRFSPGRARSCPYRPTGGRSRAR